jgi:hypothetical protein
MSARIQNLTAVMVGALAVACSKPSTQGTDRSTQVPSGTELPTVASQAPSTDQPLVSAIEAGQTDLKLVRPAERKPPQRVAVKGKGEVPGTDAGSVPQPAIDMGEVTPSVSTASQAPVTDTPIDVAMAPVPRGPSPGGDGSDGGGVGQEPTLMPERGTPGTIIIRGGMGGIEDDCKRHPNGGVGYPGGGIAINNRMPPVGSTPVMARNPSRQPFTPGRMGGTGGIGVGRRGIR